MWLWGSVVVALTAAALSAAEPVAGLVLLVALAFVLAVRLEVTRRAGERSSSRADRLRGKAQTILERVGDAVVVTDAAGRLLECNEAADGLIRLRRSRAIGHPCSALLALRCGDKALDCSEGCALLRQSVDGRTNLGIEVWREREDGRRQPLLVNVAAVEGDEVEVVHSFRDITRLKEAEEAKNLFLATASHELKTPLTVVQGFAELLLEERYSSDEQRKHALKAIVARAVQLDRIVERLLLTSRIEAGRTKVRPRALELEPLLRERVDEIAEATGRKVRLGLPGTLPDSYADPEALITVIDHLLDNAAKYSPDGGPIQVETAFDERTVIIRVTDHGIGMDAEQAARCFDKFWQGESSPGRRFGGSGIGLYIVRSLVEAMDGRVEVDSEPDHRTTFSVTLPRADAVRDEDALEITSPEPGVGEPLAVREFMRQLGIPTRRPV